MTVIAFDSRLRPPGRWQTCELDQLAGTFAGMVADGQAGGWEIAVTETGDPQFYLLGPAPGEECILCISRLGRTYLLEDGGGRFVFKHVRLERIATEAVGFLRKQRTRLVARILLLWCALRHALEEKVEPLLVEGEDLLTHFAPQLVALA